ncbi:Rne/Rng family ribonuclease, partial [Miniimonas arenae]|uniref:Rne/Rng family ribonuclease n=1 Tax=Miniimonas arenae TaxID=676201 RepID=UPI0035E44402
SPAEPQAAAPVEPVAPATDQPVETPSAEAEPESDAEPEEDELDGEHPAGHALTFSAAPVHPVRAPEQQIDVFAAFGLGTARPAEAGADAAAADEPAAEKTAEKTNRARKTRRDTATAAPSAPESDAPASDEATGSTPDDESQPRLAASALLFQPPASTPRRRRSKAGAEGETTEPSGAGSAEGPESAASDDTADDAEPKPARSRGSRRGRGRGAATRDETEESVVEVVEATEPTDATTEPTDGPDATDDVEPGEQDEAGEGTDDSGEAGTPRRRRRRGGRGRRRTGESGGDAGGEDDADSTDADGETDRAEDEPEDAASSASDSGADGEDDSAGGSSRRRRRRRGSSSRRTEPDTSDSGRARAARDEVTALKGSTRLEAKRLRRREGRDFGRRRQVITEAEFLARRESVERAMVVRERAGMTQIAVLEDGVLVEHYVARAQQTTMVGNVYLGRVQNVLPSMEAAFVDLGRGRNAVLYAGEVNWEASGLEGQPRRIEQALKSGDQIVVQVTKDPIGHKGARLTSQITLAGRYLVLVPSGAMTGISRKLPDTERARLKKLLGEIVPEGQGVIVRTAAEGASEEELRRDVERLSAQWKEIEAKSTGKKTSAPALLKGEPELSLRVVRDVFNEDFSSLTVSGDGAWSTISEYVGSVAPDLVERLHHWTGPEDVFASKRIDEQLAKGMDRKVWLPSGGSLVIDRTEAMTVVDVNTGKFTGSGGTLEETVTRNNLEAAEEIVRQLRLRDIGGIVVIDFIDMVLESNRDLVLRRLIECLGRDRTRHQVAEVTSLGLVQMTRKRVGQGLVEAFSTPCEHCRGRGFIVSSEPHAHDIAPEPEEETPRVGRRRSGSGGPNGGNSANAGSGRSGRGASTGTPAAAAPVDSAAREAVKATLAQIAAAAQHAHQAAEEPHAEAGASTIAVVSDTAPDGEPQSASDVETTGASDGDGERAIVDGEIIAEVVIELPLEQVVESVVATVEATE